MWAYICGVAPFDFDKIRPADILAMRNAWIKRDQWFFNAHTLPVLRMIRAVATLIYNVNTKRGRQITPQKLYPLPGDYSYEKRPPATKDECDNLMRRINKAKATGQLKVVKSWPASAR